MASSPRRNIFLNLLMLLSISSTLRQVRGLATMSRLRVVTYNLLTPNYATPKDYPVHPPQHFNKEKRYSKIIDKLQAETDQGAVIALQEISRSWAGPLHTFFAKNGYHFVHSGYGRPASGYMGVGLAWPTKNLEALSVEISRLANAKAWPQAPPPTTLEMLGKLPSQITKRIIHPFRNLLRLATGKNMQRLGRGPQDDLSSSKDRSNTVIIARLKAKTGNGADFTVGCYHMPCEFRRPPIMTIHAALLAQRVQALAAGSPHIITGDFNFQPSWPQYQLLTEGAIPTDHPHYPPMPSYDPWLPTINQPLRSTAVVKWGKEPEFTCYSYADRETGEIFCEPLDYIFVSPQWQVVDAVQLPSKEEVLKLPCPYPDENEPSDHVLVWADLKLE